VQNVEAKFKLANLVHAREVAARLGFEASGILSQRDTFFQVAHGKLKLREEAAGAWLIHYRRRREGGLELSDYEIVPVPEPARTRSMLASALGIIAEVRKERTLLMRGNIRLHLDRVEGLGDFGEIEAVLESGEISESNRDAVREILSALDINERDLIGVSYFEMMLKKSID
jgi:predicted adenylyl cyclase CyaB